MTGPTVRIVTTNELDIEVGIAGAGPPLVLLHGFPHTWRLWTAMIPTFARSRRVIAADLRGLGGTTRAHGGYDVMSLSRDVEQLLDALDVEAADFAAIDAGAPAAFAFAVQHPRRVRKLILMEATLGTLPGAEEFFAAGPPWWFGFHQIPGLAETVLEGHEDEYLDFFYRIGTHSGRGIDPAIRDAFVAAYRGSESLRCGFEHYRSMPESAQQLAELTAHARLTTPTLAVGAQPVGDTMYRQLEPLADDLRGEVLADCGHIMPLDRPDALARLVVDFLAADPC